MQSRPDLAFECNQLQKRIVDLRVRDLQRANRAVKEATKNRFEIMLRPLGHDAGVVAFHDAGLYCSVGVEIDEQEYDEFSSHVRIRNLCTRRRVFASDL